jgi:hypothetical protein
MTNKMKERVIEKKTAQQNRLSQIEKKMHVQDSTE